jgi:hypothetical protein
VYLAASGVVVGSDVPREAVIEAGVNLFLGLADSGSPADLIESILQNQTLDEQPGFIDDLGRSDHPRTGELLELIGRHHPEKTVAKHARKVAHRWRSGLGSR